MNDGVTCLLSIYKEYADRIFAGDKLFEFRKRRPEWLNTGTHIVLFSADEPKIILGGFTVAGIWQGSPASLWKRTSSRAGIDRNSYFRYYEGLSVAYAFLISEVWQAKGTQTVFDLCGQDKSFVILTQAQTRDAINTKFVNAMKRNVENAGNI